jgi:predicted Zn-dependent protease
MRKRTTTITLGVLVLMLIGLNAQMASAHRWWLWHWNKSTIRYWNFASRNAEAQAAINDWNACSGLTLSRRTGHTDVSVYDGNFGDTGWAGLASIKNVAWDWWCPFLFCGETHGHARYNSYYSYSSTVIQGVFCQEVGHLFGLGHSPHGCMGLGYFANISGNQYRVNRAHSCADVRAYTH